MRKTPKNREKVRKIKDLEHGKMYSTASRPPAALPSSPRDNLFLVTNYKNPETAMVSGFSLSHKLINWCKFGAKTI